MRVSQSINQSISLVIDIQVLRWLRGGGLVIQGSWVRYPVGDGTSLVSMHGYKGVICGTSLTCITIDLSQGIFLARSLRIYLPKTTIIEMNWTSFGLRVWGYILQGLTGIQAMELRAPYGLNACQPLKDITSYTQSKGSSLLILIFVLIVTC